MPSKFKKAIGAVKDHTSISLAKVSGNNTSNLEVVVLKATTHDDIPIDEHYVHEILILVSSNKIYAAACARAIGKRIGRTRNWIVALKSLMLVLRIFQDGDPYFPREVLHSMKKGAKILNLSSFRDDSNSSPWDFTAFVRTFALYLDERLDCFLTGKLQRRYTHKVKDQALDNKIRRGNEPVRDMKPAMLLDRISYWQRLLERAIATRPTGAAKMNRLVQISLYSVVQESFDLYKDISDGLALLLDSFFHLQYQNCVSAFQTCVKAAKQFEELSAFYSLCKSMGVGRTSEYPSVQTVSEELLETLQEFLKDQSSFPATNIRSPNRILLLHAPQINSKSVRHDSYGAQSDFSGMTSTDYASSRCTSLEDLMSATEIAVTTPSISIDLEAYNDQFEEVHAQGDGILNRLSASVSTHSLPVSCSIGDLVSLDDWPIQEENEQNKQKQKQEKGQENTEEGPKTSSTTTGWELVLAESITTTQSSLSVSNPPMSTFNAFSKSISTTQLANAHKPTTNAFNAFSESIITTTPHANASKPPKYTFNAFREPIRTTQLENPPNQQTDTFNVFTEPITTMQSTIVPNSHFSQIKQQQKLEINVPPNPSGIGWELDLVVPTVTLSSQPTTSKQALKIKEIRHTTPSSSGWEFDLPLVPEQAQKLDEIRPSIPSGIGWELGLLPYPQQGVSEEVQKNEEIRPPTPSSIGWELALVVPPTTSSPKPTPNTFTTSTDLDNLFNPSNHYNPFLQDATNLPSTSASTPDFQIGLLTDANNNTDDLFASAPTFQAYDLSAPTFQAYDFPAAPTFSAKNPNSMMVTPEIQNDPFAIFSNSDQQQLFGGSMNQPNLLHEQQLWLQNQNKIIAKHIA